jgi:hypothetical protein
MLYTYEFVVSICGTISSLVLSNVENPSSTLIPAKHLQTMRLVTCDYYPSVCPQNRCVGGTQVQVYHPNSFTHVKDHVARNLRLPHRSSEPVACATEQRMLIPRQHAQAVPALRTPRTYQ